MYKIFLSIFIAFFNFFYAAQIDLSIEKEKSIIIRGSVRTDKIKHEIYEHPMLVIKENKWDIPLPTNDFFNQLKDDEFLIWFPYRILDHIPIDFDGFAYDEQKGFRGGWHSAWSQEAPKENYGVNVAHSIVKKILTTRMLDTSLACVFLSSVVSDLEKKKNCSLASWLSQPRCCYEEREKTVCEYFGTHQLAVAVRMLNKFSVRSGQQEPSVTWDMVKKVPHRRREKYEKRHDKLIDLRAQVSNLKEELKKEQLERKYDEKNFLRDIEELKSSVDIFKSKYEENVEELTDLVEEYNELLEKDVSSSEEDDRPNTDEGESSDGREASKQEQKGKYENLKSKEEDDISISENNTLQESEDDQSDNEDDHDESESSDGSEASKQEQKGKYEDLESKYETVVVEYNYLVIEYNNLLEENTKNLKEFSETMRKHNESQQEFIDIIKEDNNVMKKDNILIADYKAECNNLTNANKELLTKHDNLLKEYSELEDRLKGERLERKAEKQTQIEQCKQKDFSINTYKTLETQTQDKFNALLKKYDDLVDKHNRLLLDHDALQEKKDNDNKSASLEIESFKKEQKEKEENHIQEIESYKKLLENSQKFVLSHRPNLLRPKNSLFSMSLDKAVWIIAIIVSFIGLLHRASYILVD
jgi:hypothetical protein